MSTGGEREYHCSATTAKGKPCRGQPMKGRGVCKAHSGDENIGRRAGGLSDPRVVERLLVRLQAGSTIEDACLAGGIGPTTYYRWMETGEADEQAGCESPQRQFRERALRARAEARVMAVAALRTVMAPFKKRTVRHHADGSTTTTTETMEPDWRAAAWFLERTDPENWGRRDHLDVDDRRRSRRDDLDLRQLSDDDLAQLEEILDRARARRVRRGHP